MLDDADVYGIATSRYYDRVYEPLRGPVQDAAFYRKLAHEAQGPVLELGCGTGRLLLAIAAEGIPCTGLDVSPRMLDALRRKQPPQTLRLVCAPMQDFELGSDRFMLIFAGFRGFQHLYTVEAQLACLDCVRRHLAPGGCFAFDVFAPDLDRLRQGHVEEEDARFELDGEEIVRYSAVDYDLAHQMMQVRMRYERRQDGEVIDNEIVEMRMRYFFRYELEHLLARAGFDDVRIYAGFDDRPFDYVSGEMVVLARATEAVRIERAA